MQSKISIIIPVVREDRAVECVEAIRKNAGIPEEDYQIIIKVDEERIGRPEMVEAMASESDTDLVMFVGDDTLPKPNFLLHAMLAMNSFPDGWGLVGLNDMITDGNSYATYWLASKRLLPFIDGEFLHTGYNHMYCDLELAVRCKLIGRYKWARNAVIEHVHPAEQDSGLFNKDHETAYSRKPHISDRNLFENRMEKIRKDNDIWHLSKIPKILHLYWGRNKKLSFMRYMTVYSFWKFNPDWVIKVHYPKEPYEGDSWDSYHQKSYNFSGDDHFDKLSEIPTVQLVEAELDDDKFDVPEVVRSDLYRLKLLEDEGGFWSDFDILFIRSMNKLSLNSPVNSGTNTVICCHYRNHRIGFIGGAPGNKGFFYELEKLYDEYKSKDLYEMDGYQAAGRYLFDAFYMYNDQSKKDIFKSSGVNIENIPVSCIYPKLANKASDIFGPKMSIADNTIGIHWYAGSIASSKFDNVITGDLVDTYTEFLFFSIMKSIYLKEEMKYSILMPYYRRPDHLHNTLVSFDHHYKGRNDVEIIIIEDIKNNENSEDNRNLRDVVSSFGNLDITILVSEVKDNCNPAPLYNEGGKIARGKFIVITNPECFHEVNILNGLDRTFDFNSDKYIICGCRNVGMYPRRIEHFSDFDYQHINWYQHSEHRDSGLHFCTAISKYHWDLIGGFDERFGQGIDFDDNDFISMIQDSSLLIENRDELITVHQRHDKDSTVFGELATEENKDARERNANLYFGKRRKDFKLGIGVPNTEKTMNPYFFDSFVVMDKPIDFTYMRPPYVGYVGIDTARNSLVTQALENGCSHILMMDTDQMYPHDTITKMLRHNLPVVGAIVHRRYPPFDPIMLRGAIGSFVKVPDEECFSGELVKVDATGCGCVLYDMEVFMKTKPPWFEIYQLESDKDVGEDIGFCGKLSEAGFDIYVDTSIEIVHTANIGVNRSFYEIYKKFAE